jgi:hypothetical protein
MPDIFRKTLKDRMKEADEPEDTKKGRDSGELGKPWSESFEPSRTMTQSEFFKSDGKKPAGPPADLLKKHYAKP